jgi:nitrogen fixation NifU-like protein
MFFYSDEVLNHFLNPRNVGELQDPDGVGAIGDPACGDYLQVQIRTNGRIIQEIRFLCQGCGAAIACASKMTELARGLSLDKARLITDQVVARALGGLPIEKLHCSNLGAGALQAAIDDYLKRAGERATGAREPARHEEAR